MFGGVRISVTTHYNSIHMIINRQRVHWINRTPEETSWKKNTQTSSSWHVPPRLFRSRSFLYELHSGSSLQRSCLALRAQTPAEILRRLCVKRESLSQVNTNNHRYASIHAYIHCSLTSPLRLSAVGGNRQWQKANSQTQVDQQYQQNVREQHCWCHVNNVYVLCCRNGS